MKTTITFHGDLIVIRTYFNFSDYELALVTMADLNNHAVTYASTGSVGVNEHNTQKSSLTEFFKREAIPITKETMLEQHDEVLQSKNFTSFIENLQSINDKNEQSH